MSFEKELDVITLGRAGVDLYSQQVGCRLEETTSFAKYLGGCAANIAVGASRMGLRSGQITRVGNDHMGRFILKTFLEEGVSCDGVVLDNSRLTALAFLGIKDAETFPLLFYRENCADMALSCSDISPEFIAKSKSLVITGTHLSSKTVLSATLQALDYAKNANTRVVFDIDYRPVLWGEAAKDMGENRYVASTGVTNIMQQVLQYCELIVGTEEEFCILGGKDNIGEAIKVVQSLSDAHILLKLGADGCVIYDKPVERLEQEGIHGTAFPIEVFNVLGAGDAFLSGFLGGWLRDEPYEVCCTLANAAGAIVVSRHGCAPAIPTWQELKYFLNRDTYVPALRNDDALNQMHWVTTRQKRTVLPLAIFALDHRSQLEEIANKHDKGPQEISAFKSLAPQVLERTRASDVGVGLLMDSKYGAKVLSDLADSDIWVARPIEKPGAKPLEFEGRPSLAVELNTWPKNHTVKCLLPYNPSDDPVVKASQEQQILRLFDACRATGHEFLLEVICDGPVAEVIERIYSLGVFPDWWKLQPLETTSEWQEVSRVINDYDPYCRGILILGLAASAEDLISRFELAAGQSLVKGFAVGRTIFGDAAEGWFSGRLSDEQAISLMVETYGMLRDRWCALVGDN